jgi:hypothetical protein
MHTSKRDALQPDFRYSPLSWQNCFGFPDDPCKSLIGERGDLRYGYQFGTFSLAYFSAFVEFSFFGMETDRLVELKLESPTVPIIRTVLERTEARMTLTTFASNCADEGRVDNVLMEVRPTKAGPRRHRTARRDQDEAQAQAGERGQDRPHLRRGREPRAVHGGEHEPG